MSRDRYQEMYSDYREGTLEAGLRENLEAHFSAEEELLEDYRAFETVYAELNEGAGEVIVVPDSLSARIFDRLDALPVPAVRGGFLSGLFGPRLRTAGFAGLAAVAIVGGFFALSGVTRGPSSTAGLVPSGLSGPETPRVVLHDGGKVFVEFETTGNRAVSIRSAPEAVLLQRYDVQGQALRAELSNPHPAPAAFSIQVDRDAVVPVVVLPGSEGTRRDAIGSGDLLAFARALSATYRVPVTYRVANPNHTVSWNFAGAEAQTEAVKALESVRLLVDVMPGGLISISDR